MAPQRRFSGPPSEGSDPRARWREYTDDAAIPDDPEWTDDDVDPSDGRPLPRRRRRGGRVARALAWIGGAALLMTAGGALALATWPRPSGPVPTVAAPVGDVAAPATGTAPREGADARERDDDEPRPPDVAARADEPARIGPGVTLDPPPLPPLPPALEPATPAAASPREPAAPAPAPAPVQPETSRPRTVRSAAPPPPSSPPRDTRTSAEIMADFLVGSGDRAQAEATARAYAEWYEAGSAERAYWLDVLGAIRARP